MFRWRRRMTNSLLKTNIAAFQANTGSLWKVRGKPPVGVDNHLGMMAGTSPSMTFSEDLGPIIAFQANTGTLFIFSAGGGIVDTQLPMMRGTSPYICGYYNGGFVVAYQSDK